MIAQQHHIRHFEFFENVALLFKLLCHAKVRQVATVHHKVDVGASIDTLHRLVRFVVPPLCIANQHKFQGLFSGTRLLNARHVSCIDIVRTIQTSIVRMVIYDVARRQHQRDQKGNYISYHRFHTANVMI